MATSTLNFSAQVNDWVRKTEGAMRSVFQTSAAMTIKEVIQRTPVDTGFLRASLTVNMTGPLPANQGGRIKPPGHVKGQQIYQDQPYALVIAGANIGDTIHASFVANYAAHVEYGANGHPGAGMVRLAAQNWSRNVSLAADSVLEGRLASGLAGIL